MTANFALLETVVSSFVASLISKVSQLGQIVTAKLSFKGLVALLSALFRHRIQDPVLIAELEALLGRAHNVEVRRNTVVHSFWGAEDDASTRVRIKVTAKTGKGIRHQFEDMTAEQIEDIARAASVLAYDLQMFVLRLPDGLINIVRITIP